MKYKSVYVSNENKPITGSFHGIVRSFKTKNGIIFEFNSSDNANRASKILRQSGYEIVRTI